MMLWEKKIQLAKETQAALDPNVGASEIRDMELEIHRMKLRYASMMKIQEKMITEMEHSVHRRESISMRTRSKGNGGGQLTLQKQISELTKKIKQTAYDVQECDKGMYIILTNLDIYSFQDSRDRIGEQLRQGSENCSTLEDTERDAINMLELATTAKAVASGLTIIQQRQTKWFEDISKGKYSFMVRDPVARRVELLREKEKLEKVTEVIKKVGDMGTTQVGKLSSVIVV